MPCGTSQDEEAGKKLREMIGRSKVMFYHSPFLRDRQTFEKISMSFTDFHSYEADDLREQEWGNLQQKEEIDRLSKERDSFGSYFFRFPNGESGADVCTRLSVFLNTLHRDFEKRDFARNVIIVSHGLTIRLFCKRWFHWTVEQYELLRNPRNCEIIRLEIMPPLRLREDCKYCLTTPFRTYSSQAEILSDDVQLHDEQALDRPE